ncbi:MAG: 7-carboxy-7-deazaguanine synthase QueE [Parvicellaceae bacterium]|tara:strand:+ start:561 stop:1163 length:603 start_codon:yes stop_codon:yes gene_type:complete
MNSLPVMEQFVTLQGEGFFTGKPAVFIRLGGCDVGCTWCDVKESWDPNDHPVLKVEDIVDKILKFPTNFVVITGGEPTLHNLTTLVKVLKKHNKYIAIETAGTNPIPTGIDWVCFSPKKFKKPIDEVYSQVNELKVVITNLSDIRWAQSHAKKITCDNAMLYLQPEWSKSDDILPEILNFLQENPEWRLSLQTHKYLKIP